MENRIARFETSKGTFDIELFEDKAPKTTENFIKLVEKGFYNGLIFHRVIDGFMIQGGSGSAGKHRGGRFFPRFKNQPDESFWNSFLRNPRGLCHAFFSPYFYLYSFPAKRREGAC